jgi:hypothetical protein
MKNVMLDQKGLIEGLSKKEAENQQLIEVL